jgi:hypothetical protein
MSAATAVESHASQVDSTDSLALSRPDQADREAEVIP